MNDERYLRDWLQDTTDTATDRTAAADKVMARLPQTPQRRRRIPWLPARRTNHDSTTIGRTRLMFSPVSAIGVGALALTAAGVFYVAQPSGQEAPLAPAAEHGSGIAPRLFTGTRTNEPGCYTNTKNADLEYLPGLKKERGWVHYCTRWETTDPRLNGQSTVVWNSDILSASDDAPGGHIGSGRELITTPEGTWEGTLTKVIVDDGLELESGWYIGGGGHDGLVAYVTLQGGGESLWGYVSDDPPPVPEYIPASE